MEVTLSLIFLSILKLFTSLCQTTLWYTFNLLLIGFFVCFYLIFLLLFSHLNLPFLYVWYWRDHINIQMYCAIFIWLFSNYISSLPTPFPPSCAYLFLMPYASLKRKLYLIMAILEFHFVVRLLILRMHSQRQWMDWFNSW